MLEDANLSDAASINSPICASFKPHLARGRLEQRYNNRCFQNSSSMGSGGLKPGFLLPKGSSSGHPFQIEVIDGGQAGQANTSHYH